MRRESLSRGASRSVFRKGVMREHPKNRYDRPMRGGIRL